MSNEKLGAEQGRDASFKAFSDYVKKLCAILDEEGIETEQIDCDLHNLAENLLVKQMLGTLIAQPRTEQAYHARGAGREALEAAHHFLSHTGNHRALVGDNFAKPSVRYNELKRVTKLVKDALREPGADTRDNAASRRIASATSCQLE